MNVHATSQDGLWSVLEGIDYPPGIGRSKTCPSPGDALKAQWEPNLITAPGPKSLLGKYVLVRTMDLTVGLGGIGRVVSPKSYIPGTIAGRKHIPDYPHKCLVCGGNIVILFSSSEHEGGVCPGPSPKPRLTAKSKWP